MKTTDIKPIIAIDTRERLPLRFKHYPTEAATLATGDYSVKGFENSWTTERKSIPDLIGSLTHGRDRFMRELQRMKAYPFRRLLIEGKREDIESHNYRSRATPQSILGSLAAIEIRYNLPIVYAESRLKAAQLIEQWAFYYLREKIKQAQSIIALTEPQTVQDAPEEVTA